MPLRADQLVQRLIPRLDRQGRHLLEVMRHPQPQRAHTLAATRLAQGTVIIAAALAEPVPANPPVATGQLTSLRRSGEHNFYLRSLLGSAADNVADANGYIRYYDLRMQASPNGIDGHAVTTAWASSATADRAGTVRTEVTLD